MKLGFLREYSGDSKNEEWDTTGLDEYLKIIFPDVHDWERDKCVPGLKYETGKRCLTRPDYRSEELKLIVEFDGIHHFKYASVVIFDEEKRKLYESAGYKVVRIPYFIQLTNSVVKTMFGVDVKDQLFDEDIPSFGKAENNLTNYPADLNVLGLERMAKEFIKYPQQYKVNIKKLKTIDKTESGIEYLEREMQRLASTINR